MNNDNKTHKNWFLVFLINSLGREMAKISVKINAVKKLGI